MAKIEGLGMANREGLGMGNKEGLGIVELKMRSSGPFGGLRICNCSRHRPFLFPPHLHDTHEARQPPPFHPFL